MATAKQSCSSRWPDWEVTQWLIISCKDSVHPRRLYSFIKIPWWANKQQYLTYHTAVTQQQILVCNVQFSPSSNKTVSICHLLPAPSKNHIEHVCTLAVTCLLQQVHDYNQSTDVKTDAQLCCRAVTTRLLHWLCACFGYWHQPADTVLRSQMVDRQTPVSDFPMLELLLWLPLVLSVLLHCWFRDRKRTRPDSAPKPTLHIPKVPLLGHTVTKMACF